MTRIVNYFDILRNGSYLRMWKLFQFNIQRYDYEYFYIITAMFGKKLPHSWYPLFKGFCSNIDTDIHICIGKQKII